MSSVVDPALLGAQALFRGLPAEALRYLAERLRRKTFAAGATVLTAEQPGEALYVIASGSVRIFLDEADGSEVTLAFLGPGDTVGEMSLVDRSGRSANVSIVEREPMFDTVSWAFFGTSSKKRTQRLHRMQRSSSSTITSPRLLRFSSLRRGSAERPIACPSAYV